MLTGPLRARLVTVVSESVGRVPADRLPPAVRRIAAFAPGKRARLGGEQLLAAAEADADLRTLVAEDVRDQLGAEPSARDAAVLAWLERDEGWEDVVAGAADEDRAREDREALRAAEDRAERAERRAEAAAEELREARRQALEDHEQLRRDNAELRRRLGEARAAARRAGEQAEEVRLATERTEASSRGERTALEAEARRLRTRVSELEQRLARAQREVRLDRDEATLRARLLLDSVLDAATGLRRELALPAVEGSPADRVVADEAGTEHRASSGTGSMRTDDPALLAQLLALPRAHVVVDGYNVTKSAWPEVPLDVQRDRLLTGMGALAARSTAELTVVFDAAETSGPRPAVSAPRGVRVRFTPTGVIADDLIRDFVAAEPEGRPVVVVTSDREVVRDVTRRRGVRAVDALALVRLLARG